MDLPTTLPPNTVVGRGAIPTQGGSPQAITISALVAQLLANFPNETANTVLAGPTTGAAAAATFRALVSADLPAPNQVYKTGSGGVTVAATDDQVIINKTVAGTTAVTLPAASTRAGRPLEVKDGSGNSSAFNITITPNGAEKIDGAASLVLSNDYQSVILYPVTGVGWFVHPVVTSSTSILNALNYAVKGDGSTNDASAINTLFTLASTLGAIVYFPGGKTYELGSSALTVPDGVTVMCGFGATFRRSSDPGSSGTWSTTYGTYTGAMISLGNHCRWTGGILNNTAVLGTSTTSIVIGTGAKTFTVSAGLNIAAGNFLRIQSRGTPASHMEGTVTSYSGTSLVMSITFQAGSGTFTDWNILAGAVYQCPMVLHGVTESLVENVRTTGNWYVGLLMDGWNTSGGSSVSAVTYCTFRNCFAESVMNRGFYIYGGCSDNLIDGCFVNGGTGTTDYGFNLNPANATGNTNQQLRNKIANSTVNASAFQGFEIGDQCSYNVFDGCTANGLTDTAGVGFLIQLANSLVPQYNKLVGCVANNCVGFGFEILGANYNGLEACQAVVCGKGFYIGPSGGTQSAGVTINSSKAISSTTIGFQVAGNSDHCDLNMIQATGNTTNGVQIDAGAVTTVVSGHSYSNTSSNLVNNGTTSNIANLVVT